MHRFSAVLLLALCSFSAGAQPARNATQAVQFIKLANTLRELDKAPESVSLLQRAMPAVARLKERYWEAVANELLGLSYRDLRDTTAALRHLEKARAQYAGLKYVASAWAVNEIVRDLSGKNLYAGIQIGSNDVKLAIFKTDYESDFYEKDVRSILTVPNVTFFADASGRQLTGPDVLRTCLDSIRRYNIPNERIFVVYSSDLNRSVAAPNRRALYAQLGRVLPAGNFRIDTTLTPLREAELFTIGAIPRKAWPTTSSLDVGETSTMGGYFEGESGLRPETGRMKRRFHAVSVPVGTTTLVQLTENRRSLGPDAFRREAQRVVRAVADTALKVRFGHAGLQKRRTVGLGGAVARALVTYLYPDKTDVTAVAITPADVDRFKRMALNDYDRLIKPDLGAISDAGLRSRAERDVAAVQQQLTEKELVAGALWLDALVRAYSAVPAKRFVFVRNAEIGWVTGKFLETISGEYESAIAQGALYTR